MKDLQLLVSDLNTFINSDVNKGCLGFGVALGVCCDDYEADKDGGACEKCNKDKARAILAAIDAAGEAKEQLIISAALPECVQMPRFDNGELVEFCDLFGHGIIDSIRLYSNKFGLVNEKGEEFLYRYGVPVKHSKPVDTIEWLNKDLEEFYNQRRGQGLMIPLQSFVKRAYELGKLDGMNERERDLLELHKAEAGKEC